MDEQMRAGSAGGLRLYAEAGRGLRFPRSATVRSGRSGRLGAGLVDVPVVEVQDPAAAVIPHPEVPETQRFCSRCDAAVGRRRGDRQGRVRGYCGACRHPYSFVPSLGAGDLVAGQYRIAGCLAYGGLGWIYLAQDERVSRRWVVLKGLLDSQDPDAMAAALAERRFLARVEHPNVVRIYNFVQHAGAGYIVMEYVGGRTLKDVRRAGALPVELAIAYVLGLLPAFRYLHGLGLLYNDLKVENVMLQGEDIKLIDLGATTRLDDPDPIVYGTDGYQAPEVARRGPSVASDLYSIARCLAVLCLDFRGDQPAYRFRLPGPDEQPLLAEHDPLRRFLVKGTAPRPEARFQSAEEMADQLFGVLREVVAVRLGTWTPATSTLFGSDLHAAHATAGASAVVPDWRHLPPVTIDPGDAAASLVLGAGRLGDPALQVSMLKEAVGQGRVPATAEAALGLARALIELDEFAEAGAWLVQAERAGVSRWRLDWYSGLALLARQQPNGARLAFDRVCAELPGELAPRLALALAAELAGDLESAARHYGVVVATDPGFTSAAFGLGRVREALGDWRGAVEAYGLVASTSSLHVEAQVALARTLLGHWRPTPPGIDELARASAAIESVALEPGRRAALEIELLEAALPVVAAHPAAGPGPAAVTLLGRPPEENAVRQALEGACRRMARLLPRAQRVRLVDRANQVRMVSRR